MSDYNSDHNQRTDRSYRNAETLRRLYHDERMTLREVGDELGVASSTIRTWMEKHDIERRTGREKPYRVTLRTRKDGYVQWFNDYDGKQSTCLVHQLVTIAHGADPHEVFSGGEFNIHHKNGIAWDNRPSNLDFVTSQDHQIIESVSGGENLDYQASLPEFTTR